MSEFELPASRGQAPGRPPPGYAPGHQGYGHPGWGYPPVVQRTNGLAIASMVLGIVWIYWIGSILAIVFGHIALGQIRKDPSYAGKGMAIAGVVLGYIGIAILAAGLLTLVVSSAG